jgi:hypothetical protein
VRTGLGQSERMSVETGISEGEYHRDALLSDTAVEADSRMREHGSPTLKERTDTTVSVSE